MEMITTIISSCATVLVALIGIVAVIIQAQNSKKELAKKYTFDFQQYKNQDLYEIRKKVLFEALTLFDDYISWLTVDGEKPIRKQDCSIIDFTLRTREIYNKLCVTVSNKRLIEVFSEAFFGQDPFFIGKLADFRREARVELGLERIDFLENGAFISRISTDDLADKENIKNVRLKK